MNALAGLQTPASTGRAEFGLHTLTPLYTGGIGQQGEALHPSGLLGGVRRFSCLLAAALGDTGFEAAVWGRAGDQQCNPSAKGVALQWRFDELCSVERSCDDKKSGNTRPGKQFSPINWSRADGRNRAGWYFNYSHIGDLSLVAQRHGISDAHWQLLLLALRIQIRHATFGAKDQHGLGVLGCAGLPEVEPLQRAGGRALTDRPGLDRAFFAELHFDAPPPERDADYGKALEDGLRLREALRGAFRRTPAEANLRHYLFGELNRWGSAVNVSALYRRADGNAGLRVWGAAPHTSSVPRDIAEALDTAVEHIHEFLQKPLPFAHMTAKPCRLAVWENGRAHANDLVAWINRLAGVAP